MVTYPQDWDVVELGKKCEVTSSKRVFESEWTKSGIPFLRTRDIASFQSGTDQKDKLFISESTYKEKTAVSGEPVIGDLLVTGVGTIGLPYLVSKAPMYFKDGNILWIKQSDSFVPQFLYLMFLAKDVKQQIEDGSGFTTVGTFTIKNAKKLSVPCPETGEQKSVAETLSCMDEHIANLTELIEKKKGIRDGALEDLVSGRTRLKGFEKLKSNNIRIDTFLKVKRGKRLVRSQLSNYANSNAKVPVYQNSVVALGYYSSSNCCQQSVFVIAAGNAGDIGFSTVPFWAADDCYYFEPNEKIHQKYLYYCLLNKQQYIYSQTRRTSIPRLSHDVLERITILIPPIAEQKAIATVLTTMDDEIISLEEEKDKMLQIKAGAMDDLLTGRIRLTRQGG